MKRTKKLLILLGVLLVVCIVTIVVTKHEEKKEQIKNADEVILNLDTSGVTKLSWTYDDTALSFTKNDVWNWDEDSAFPVDESKIDDLLKVFENFEAAFAIEDVDDLSLYGLKNPMCTIDIETGDENYEITLGDFSKMDSQRYVSIGDGKVYLVKNDPFDQYETEISKLIDNDEIPSLGTATVVSFTGLENYSFSLDEESTASYCETDKYYVNKEDEELPLDSSKVSAYLSGISNLDTSDYASYNASSEELTEYGLDNPELTVQVTYLDTDDDGTEAEKTFEISVGENKTQLEEKAATEASGEEYSGTVSCYARVGNSQIIYNIARADYANLVEASYNDLRHKKVFTANPVSITGLEVTLEGKNYGIESAKAKDEETEDESMVFSLNGTEVDITNLTSALEAMTVNEFCDSPATDKEEISMVIHLDNENHPELTLKFYRNDGSNCIVEINGEYVGLVERSLVVDFIEAVNEIVLG